MKLELINSDLMLEEGEYEDRHIVETYKALKDFNIMEIEQELQKTMEIDNYLEYDILLYENCIEHPRGRQHKGGYTFLYKDYVDSFVRYLLQNKFIARIESTTFNFNPYSDLRKFIEEKDEKHDGWEKIL